MAYKCNAQFSSVNRLMNFTRLIFKIPCDCINFPIKSYVGSVTSICVTIVQDHTVISD